MATPKDILDTIFGIAMQIYENIQAAKGNQEQCRRLADKVRIVSNALEQMVAGLPSAMLEQPYDNSASRSMFGMFQDAVGITSDPITDTLPWDRGYGRGASRYAYAHRQGAASHNNSMVFVDALLDLKGVLESALVLAKEYADKNWLLRVCRNSSHTEDFDAMYALLSDSIQQLNLTLGVHIKQMIDAQIAKDAHRHQEMTSAQSVLQRSIDAQTAKDGYRHQEVTSTLSVLQKSMQQIFTKLTADMAATQKADRDAADRDRRTIIEQQKILTQQYVDVKYGLGALSQSEATHHGVLTRQLTALGADEATRHGRVTQHLHNMSYDNAARFGVIEQELSAMRTDILSAVTATKPPKPPISPKLLIPFYELRIIEHIATGSFGKIFRGRWSQHDAIIKVMEGPFTESEREAFVKEVNLLKNLRSEHVMGIYAVCYEQGRLAYVMKYMSYGNLQQYLSKHSLSVAQCYQIAYQIALGLTYLHGEGIIHRDLNSANVLLDGGLNARITGFGFAKQAHLSLSMGERTANTQWQAPEILSEIYEPNKASEIYSLGMILWSLMTGKTPYATMSEAAIIRHARANTLPPEHIPDTVPADYRELIEACCASAPGMRPTISQVVQILQLLVANTPLTATSVTGSSQAGQLLPSSAPALTPESFYLMGCDEESRGNPSRAKTFYKLAVPEYPRAKTNLGFFYATGSVDKAPKLEKAFNLFLEAAQADHVRAMVNVAKCYRKGLGVLPDIGQAEYWEARVLAASASETITPSSSSSPSPYLSPASRR